MNASHRLDPDTSAVEARYGIGLVRWLVFPAAFVLSALPLSAQPAPSVTLGVASNVTDTAATLNGTVNPSGAATSAQFEYSTDLSFSSTAAVTLSPNDGTTDQDVSANLSSLLPNTLYHCRLKASNASGTTTSFEGTFTTEPIHLVWDPGTTHAGTEVRTSASVPGSAAGGSFYFKITTQTTTVGGWRTALNVTSGEANLHIQQGGLPTTESNYAESERAGSDGFVLSAGEFGASQDWFILVQAAPGAVWNLVTGEPYALDLGALAEDASSGSGAVAMGAEGTRFFKTTVPPTTKAWRLWLNGAANEIRVRKSVLPFTGFNVDLAQVRQMLVVPPYLGTGSNIYFIVVPGDPGTTINLDSRVQPIAELAFGANTTLAVTGYGYQTYHVQVPIEQIAW